MKKLTLMLSALCLLVIVSCSKDNEINEPTTVNPNFRVTEATAKSGHHFLGGRAMSDQFANATFCYQTDLIAGQNTVAGTVTAYFDAAVNEMYVVYNTTGDWSLNTTHMSVGDCNEDIPTTGSGNPKVGQFEKGYDHTIYVNGVTEVIYQFSRDVFSNVATGDGAVYCFAAHAVVSGPSNETAWASGVEFDGASWAMKVQRDFDGTGCVSAGGGDTE